MQLYHFGFAMSFYLGKLILNKTVHFKYEFKPFNNNNNINKKIRLLSLYFLCGESCPLALRRPGFLSHRTANAWGRALICPPAYLASHSTSTD